MSIKILKQGEKQGGFTLLELLVVISIISFILAGSIFAFGVVRMKSRDSTRRANISTLRNALAMYANEFTRYPAPSAPNKQECLYPGSSVANSLVNAGFLTEVPKDLSWPTIVPSTVDSAGRAISPSKEFCYYYSSDGTFYYLSYYTEQVLDGANIHVTNP